MIRISKAGLFFLSACFSLFLKYLKGTDSVREVRDPHLTVQGSQLVEMGGKGDSEWSFFSCSPVNRKNLLSFAGSLTRFQKSSLVRKFAEQSI